MDAKSLNDYTKAVTGWVLSKSNKLSRTKLSDDPTKTVDCSRNLESQLETLQQHFVRMDCAEVLTQIVVPTEWTSLLP